MYPFKLNAAATRSRGKLRRTGFTLLELLAVLLIIGIFCSIAVYCLAGPYQQARRQHVVERIAQLDEQLRTATRRFGRSGELTIAFREGTVETSVGKNENGHKVQLPADLALDQVRTAVRNESYGRIVIPFTGEGHSATYAVRLKPREGVPQWILFAGVTGQFVRVQNERDIDAIFRRLAPGRTNAP